MKVNELYRWGIPERVISVWKERQGEMLLPVQSRAIRKGLLGNPGDDSSSQRSNMLISAPTSAGKSFCAEMAAVKTLTERKKSILLFPLRSLAEENYRLLKKTYEPLGVKTIIVTSDHPENDALFRDSKYNIAVAVYEKFDLLLTSALDSLVNVGLVVVDEIQTIAEPGRGTVLERLLTKIAASDYKLTVIGLSAVIGDSAVSAGKLADWLGAALVEETARPVDLIRGVAAEGLFYNRSYNTGVDNVEPFITATADEKPFDAFVRQIKAETGRTPSTTGGQTLVFLKSRAETVEYAFKLAAAVSASGGWTEAKNAIERLSEEEPSSLNRTLRQALGRGIAFHNSDLTSTQREIVENAFRNREVKVLFSTTTLAMGVNLFADTVYLETVKYISPRYGRRPSLIPISQAEFDNMTGRAGRHRHGRQSKPGKAVVLAHSALEREILWKNYIAVDKPKPVESAFASIPLIDWVLDIICSGLADDVDSLNRVYAATFYRAGDDSNQNSKPEFDSILETLQELSLIKETSASNKWLPTALGKAAAGTGLSVDETKSFLSKLESGSPQTLFGWIALALSSPDWNAPPGFLNRMELVQESPLKMLYQQFDSVSGGLEQARFLIPENHQSEPLPPKNSAAIKALLLLNSWCQGLSVERLEELFQIHLGQVVALAETVSHLIKSLSAIVGAKEKESPLISQLQKYAFEIRHGLPAEFKPLYEKFSSVLKRSDFLNLKNAGLESISQLCEFDEEKLNKIIKGKQKLALLKNKITIIREEEFMCSLNINPGTNSYSVPTMVSQKVELLEIDGSPDKERFVVKVNDQTVRLTAKSFKYLAKLAWSRANSPASSGWVYKEDIEVGFNQARYLYRMKNEVNAGLGYDWPLIENNRLGYYRLNADPDKIRINVANLQNNPDHEIRQIVSGEAVLN
ncbi:MAG: DEAD/DEAH box helicase [candidate division Zixibacteria bacterium]|nr:DEAD/DEAH box helicase [candidate division Zixibacteria bacterium]